MLSLILKDDAGMELGKISPFILAWTIGFLLVKFLPSGLTWLEAALTVTVPLFIYGVVSAVTSSRKNHSNTPDKLPAFKGEMRLAASLQEALIIVNDRHHIEHINPSAYALFPNIRTGSALSGILKNPQLDALVQESLTGREPDAFTYVISDPVERHIRVTGSPLRPISDTVTRPRAVIVFYDVTDIERANALRADFLANASHELKTPVASLLGYIETLNGHAKDDPEAREKFLGIMQQQARRMQRLISDILSLRRIELSEHKAPTETADLYLAFLAAQEAVAPMAERKKIAINYAGPKEMLVTGTQDELVQLTLNILDNAVKMSADKSTVKITGAVIDNWQAERAFPDVTLAKGSARRRVVNPPQAGIPFAELRIQDTGPGFSRDHLPRLSERFYRIAGDRSSKDKGTGLGLAIVKHITMRHRGGLMIETAEKVGTEFTILIPSATAPAKTDETPDKPDNQVFLNFKNLS